ncbi:aminodeoxychorismate synthase component I [Paraglaciecola aestuariivivens]
MYSSKYHLAIDTLDLPKHTPITDIFAHYAQQEWAMLLDSADSKHQDGRFDILVADPIATVTTKGKNSVVWTKSNNQQTNNQQNPLKLVQDLLHKCMDKSQCSQLSSLPLPFKVGALGMFGYDLGKVFEALPDKNLDHYSAPDMAVGIYAWSLIKDNHQQRFYLCYLQEYAHPSAKDIQNLLDKPALTQGFSLTSDWQANMSQDQYNQKMSRISHYLQAGDCYQINLAQRFTADYQGNEWQAYQMLREANKAPFSAFIRLKDATLLSISPERFISVDQDNQVQTKPIKGTRPRHTDASLDQAQIEALKQAEKDQAENLMIVDLLRNDLSKHCQAGTVEVPALFEVESFAAVHHLVSTITATLPRESHALDLLQGAFPGGSITGAPKIRAMQIIDELEPNNRNIYCGSIGYMSAMGDMDTSICIRTLLCETDQLPKKLHCWAGGGIVLDSDPEAEYQESLDKVSKILPILNPKQTDIELG